MPSKLRKITAQPLKQATKVRLRRRKARFLMPNKKFLFLSLKKSLILLQSRISPKNKLDSSKIYPMLTMPTMQPLPLLPRTKITTTI